VSENLPEQSGKEPRLKSSLHRPRYIHFRIYFHIPDINCGVFDEVRRYGENVRSFEGFGDRNLLLVETASSSLNLLN
jgi:hypothetical protein